MHCSMQLVGLQARQPERQQLGKQSHWLRCYKLQAGQQKSANKMSLKKVLIEDGSRRAVQAPAVAETGRHDHRV